MLITFLPYTVSRSVADIRWSRLPLNAPPCLPLAVLADGHLPRAHPGHPALLRLRDGHRHHPGQEVLSSSSLSLSHVNLLKASSLTLFFIISSRISSDMQSVIVLYSFSRPFLLNEQIQASENQTFYKHHILKVIMRVPLMCFIASIFSFIFFQLVGCNTKRLQSNHRHVALYIFFLAVSLTFLLLSVLCAAGHRHLPALHLPESQVVSQ